MTLPTTATGPGYGCIIADPPWRFRRVSGRGCAEHHYDDGTMDADEILALPVSALAAPAAHLWLWTTDAHLELAARCAKTWGFEVHASVVWVKTAAGEEALPEPLPRRGVGNYVIHAHELCLFATRGEPHTVEPAMRPLSVFYAPRGQHSAKPGHIHDWAERISPAPRVEMFARQQRFGWDVWPRAGEDARSTKPKQSSLALPDADGKAS